MHQAARLKGHLLEGCLIAAPQGVQQYLQAKLHIVVLLQALQGHSIALLGR